MFYIHVYVYTMVMVVTRVERGGKGWAGEKEDGGERRTTGQGQVMGARGLEGAVRRIRPREGVGGPGRGPALHPLYTSVRQLCASFTGEALPDFLAHGPCPCPHPAIGSQNAGVRLV